MNAVTNMTSEAIFFLVYLVIFTTLGYLTGWGHGYRSAIKSNIESLEEATEVMKDSQSLSRQVRERIDILSKNHDDMLANMNAIYDAVSAKGMKLERHDEGVDDIGWPKITYTLENL